MQMHDISWIMSLFHANIVNFGKIPRFHSKLMRTVHLLVIHALRRPIQLPWGLYSDCPKSRQQYSMNMNEFWLMFLLCSCCVAFVMLLDYSVLLLDHHVVCQTVAMLQCCYYCFAAMMICGVVNIIVCGWWCGRWCPWSGVVVVAGARKYNTVVL